jgi:hypothetical protein
VKYPPTFLFWAMFLGNNLLVLALLVRLPERIKSYRSPLIVFGQTPLFFYVVHFYLLALCAFIFYREPAPLEGIYPVWAIMLLALYPLCAWYRRFKMTKASASVWRLF